MPTATMPGMAKNKTDETTEAVERKRVVRSNRWEPDVLDAIADYIQAQEVQPSEIAVMETAVREFLSKRGYWPRKRRKSE